MTITGSCLIKKFSIVQLFILFVLWKVDNLFKLIFIVYIANYHAIPEELIHASYNHIGDIDVYDGIIYGGIEAKNGNAALAKWHSSNLTLISYTITEQKGLPWVAVDPSSELLYSALWNDCCQLQIYDMHSFKHVSSLTIPTGMPNEVQGGAFYNGLLYLSSNTNVSVWSIDIQTSEKSFILSDDYIDSHIYEMEGLDFWNLEKYGLGTMHL